METVSIVIPFYNGNKYISHLKRVIDENYRTCKKIVNLELVVVNDSPWVQINKESLLSDSYSVKIINHERNQGIHQARITGIANASGEYILMFDQDDVLSNDAVLKMYKSIVGTEYDCVIGNGIFETDYGDKIILNSYGKIQKAKNNVAYCVIGNLLSSPGQCLLKKKSIPQFWKENVMYTNCSDDLFLWILLFHGSNVTYCDELVYLHVNTGENFSLNIENGIKSDLEMLDKLKNAKHINLILSTLIKLRCSFRLQKLSGKIEKPFTYYLYFIILNTYKLIIRMNSLSVKGIKYKCPGLKENSKWIK